MNQYNNPVPQIYLAHHGILGQKWGKRNGPPYPLDASSHSASEKKAGWQKSLDKQGSNKHTDTHNGSNVNRGMKIVGSILKNIGEKSVDSTLIQSYSTKGQTVFNDYTNKSSSFKRKEKEFLFSQDLSAVNPNYDPNIKKATVWNTNCTHCVSTYEFRKRGFDVTATPVTEQERRQGGVPLSETIKLFPGLSFNKVGSSSAIIQKILLGGVWTSTSKKEYAELCQKIEAFGEGTRGFIRGDGRFGGGHIFSWEVMNGHVRFIDPQNNKEDASGYFQDGRFAAGSLEYARVDNLSVNKELMSKHTMNRR